MSRTYLVDGQQVMVRWISRQHPSVYTILVAGTPLVGSVEKTAVGKFLALDDERRPLGTFLGLREAVELVVRADPAPHSERRHLG
jgi:hypothetical protein